MMSIELDGEGVLNVIFEVALRTIDISLEQAHQVETPI